MNRGGVLALSLIILGSIIFIWGYIQPDKPIDAPKQEIKLLEHDNLEDGAVVTFCGRVRNNNLGERVSGLFIEHYSGMTEAAIAKIIQTAAEKWQLGRVCVIHRIGQLAVGEQIVFVGVTSKHRHAAFAATEFIMDYLKVAAPFWKKELTAKGERWLDARASDQSKAKQWEP